MASRTILLAEDRSELRETLVALLLAGGYEVRTAGNHREALEALNGSIPDAVVTEISLHDGNGFSVARKARLADAEVPVVYLGTEVETSSVGSTHFLPRERANTEIVDIIAKLLEQRRPIPAESGCWEIRGKLHRAICA